MAYRGQLVYSSQLKTTYRLTVEQNGINRKVRGEWGSKEEAVGIGLKLYKNHNQEDYIVFLVTVLRFPQRDGTAREMPFPCKIENITESKSKTNMKTENRNRNVVRLNESQLKRIVAEELKRALNEMQSNGLPHNNYEELFNEGHTFAEEFRQMTNHIADLIPMAYTNGTMGVLGVTWQVKLEKKMKEIRERYAELTSGERR